jgi:Plant transposon protein
VVLLLLIVFVVLASRRRRRTTRTLAWPLLLPFQELPSLLMTRCSINGVDDFNELFFLVDGIYPKYSQFVKGIKDPINQTEKSYTAWQEACRIDIEQAFGTLQAK